MKVVRFLAELDPNKCKGDLHCERVCPSGAIKIAVAMVDERKCVACANCADVCPAGAIRLVERSEPLILKTDPDEVDQQKMIELCIKAGIHPMQPVCPCTDTQAGEVAAAIIKGAKTPEEVTLMTGARSACEIYCTSAVLRLLKAYGLEVTPPKNHGWYDLSTPHLRDIPEEVGNRYPSYHINEDKEMFKQFEAMLQALRQPVC